MSSANPFFALQQRVVDLVLLHPYFAGLDPATQALTEKIADLQFQVDNALLPLGFGLVVTTPEGTARENEYDALTSDEELNLTLIHNPTTDLTHNALDAQWAAMQALQGKSVYTLGANLGATTERDFFRVKKHQRRHDGPPGCNVREIHLLAGQRLL